MAFPGEKRLHLQAALLLPITALWLHRQGLTSTLRIARRFLNRANSPVLDSAKQLELALVVVKSVARANERYSLLHADCLPSSVVCWYLAQRIGSRIDLRLGVRTLTGRFEAHAWVEFAGEPLGETEDVKQIYAAMDIDRLLRSL